MDKNYTWHDIVKRMDDKICPICVLIEDRTRQKMSVLEYQHVSDVEFRKKFIDSKGFCQHHTEKFYHQSDALAHAIILGHLMHVELERFKNGTFKRKDKTQKKCMLCEAENTSEAIYLNVFLKAYKEDIFKKRYEDKGILCMNHFKALLPKLKKQNKENYNTFKSITLNKYDLLLNDLKEIKRKNDFKYNDERLNDKEKVSWQLSRKLLIDQGEHRR